MLLLPFGMSTDDHNTIMPPGNFTFARIRILALAYTAAISILTFAIVLFVLPNASRSRTPALAVIAGITLVIGFVSSGALLVPKVGYCRRRSMSRRGRVYVGLEILYSAALLLLLATVIFLEAGLAVVHASNAGLNLNPNTGSAPDHNAGRVLSALLLVFSCSTALVLTMYTGLISGLAAYTHNRTSRTDVWFADAAVRAPAFVFPLSLRFLRARDEDRASETDTERVRAAQREQLEQLVASPALLRLARHMHMRDRTTHTPAPDCACGEKLAPAPSHPAEYRALSRIYARVWELIAQQEAEARARTLGSGLGHRRAMSAPVSMLSVPTERERRRTMFLIGFDGVRFGR